MLSQLDRDLMQPMINASLTMLADLPKGGGPGGLPPGGS